MKSQSILPASCASSCFMLMIWSSRARNRSNDPVVSCFFGRIVPSDAAMESRSLIRGNLENEIARFQRLGPQTLQSHICQTAEKRLLLNGLEIVHSRLTSLACGGSPSVPQHRDRRGAA